MNAAAHTEPLSPLRANLHAYLAGTGATGALIGGALVVFIALAAFVAFNGLPLGGSGGSEGSVSVAERSVSAAPGSAALSVGGASQAVAANPAAPVGSTGATNATAGSTIGIPGSDPASLSFTPGDLGTTLPEDPTVTDPSGGLGHTIDTICGGRPECGEATGPLIDPVDTAARDTLNSVGGLVGSPTLGDSTVTAVNAISDRLIGPGSAAGGVLGGN